MEGFGNATSKETLMDLKSRKYRVLIDEERLPGAQMSMAVYYYPKDSHGPVHHHDRETEIYYCLRGSGKARVGDKIFDLEPGNVVYIPPGQEHQTWSDPDSEMDFLAMFVPPVKF